ncbi:MAG: substrate-binding domain-containing protein [Oscillospiraceae bacterium]|nr:substrate-binding domain-containing protein [Oscillospiraceae bacterium]
MRSVYILAAIAVISAAAACFIKNKIIKAALSVAGLLGFFGLSVLLAWFVLPSYIGAHSTWIPFALCGAAFAVFMLFAWKPFGVKIRRIAAVSVGGAAVIVSSAFAVPAIYQNALTIWQRDEVYLGVYQPFGRYWYVDGVLTHHESQTAALNEESELKLYDNLPRIDGATALYPLYAAFVQAVYPEPEPALDILEYSYYGELWRDLEEASIYDRDINIPLIACSRTSAAFENLIDGYADIVFLMGVSDEQRAAAIERGLELILTPVGREAFIFFVHSRNAVSGLLSSDIKRIYSGEVTNWSETGGKNDDIRAYQRPESSGSQVMLKQIMGDVPIAPAPEGDVFDMMMGMVKVVSNYRNYRNSLGYSFLYYARDMVKEHNIKFLSIDGTEPTNANIASGAYPFANDFYAVTVQRVTVRRQNEYLNPARSENIEKLLEWITSRQGRYLVEATGYVPAEY